MTRLVGVGAITLLASVLSCGSSAPVEAAASHVKVKGDTVVATFETTDQSDPCLENFVFIFASDETTKVSPGPRTTTTAVFLTVTQIDVCTGFPLFVGEGETTNLEFQIANDLSSATLTVTVPVFDSLTLQFHDFEVELTWTATAPAEREHLHEQFRDREAGIFINAQLRGLHAPAVATGTISGLGQNFATEPSTSADLMSQSAGTVEISLE